MMFNWKPNKPEETDQEKIERVRFNLERYVQKQAEQQQQWERDRADIWKSIKDLSENVNKPQPAPNVTALEQRMAVLETWRAQLHTLLVERGNTGKEKLSRTGNAASKFYGR